MTTPSPNPSRYPSGLQTDERWGPLAHCGVVNPFFYHSFVDDFNEYTTTGIDSVASSGRWVQTNASSGTVAQEAGDGGLIILTTAATNSDYESIQAQVAGFTLPQVATQYKKLFGLARLQLSDITNSAFIIGLAAVDTTPFTSIANGLYFHKASGSTQISLVLENASTATTLNLPTTAYNLVNATNIDLGFEVDSSGNINAFVGAPLVGYQIMPSSNPVLGPCAKITAPSMPATNLAPIIAIQAGAAAAKTLTVDFVGFFKER